MLLWADKTERPWDELAGFYIEALEDMPEDIVQALLKEARGTFVTMPMPAQLRRLGLEDLERRRLRLRDAVEDVAKYRQRQAEEPWPPRKPTEEERARVAAVVAQLPQVRSSKRDRQVAESLSGFRLPPDDEFNEDGTRRS